VQHLDLPSPSDIADDPELAILAALQHTLELTTRALLAAHPELTDDERPAWIPSPPTASVADLIITLANTLSCALQHYRQLCSHPRHGDRD